MGKKKIRVPLPVLPAGISVIDTHCHLDMINSGDDIGTIISRASASGVSHIITVGIDLESSKKAIDIAEQNKSVYATVGIHPHNVQQLQDKSYDELEKLCHGNKVVAYGEIGLDFIKQHAPQDVQLEHYARQVVLAKKVGLPLVIHAREAHDEVLHILKSEAPFPSSGVMHCFSGDLHLANQVLDLGFLISIPGIVTFNKAKALQEVAQKIPLNKLILETDAPFLTPDPYRGRINIPEYMLYTAQKVADLRGITVEEVARATTDNAQKLFMIPPH
ncbi:MAG: YchF/TatD family DNA exonuclease [Desulfobacterales bacterium]|nr:YchF/TatD family DNA exonuclease [Desulfobacterales bacterium]